jgi:hypothetical protein
MTPRHGVEALLVQLRVHRVGSDLARMEPLPRAGECVVVLPAAERAGAVSRRERGRLVEEEQLGEPTRLHQGRPVPPAEPEAARDPSPHLITAADVPLIIVEAASIPIDEASGRIGDQVAQR